jgi:hypothetical protein
MATYLAGADARADVNSLPLEFKRAVYTDGDPGGDVQQSEHGGYGARINTGNYFSCTMTQATLNRDASPFTTGLNLKKGQFVSNFILWLDGRDGAERYLCPVARVAEVRGTTDVGPGGMSPQDFTVENFGIFYRPGENP